MTITAVQSAALALLEAVAGRPDTVWPNEAKSKTYPRMEVYEGPVSGRLLTLDGVVDLNTFLQVDVIVEEKSYTGQMRTEVQRVIDAFPAGTSIGTTAHVSGPPVPGGYRQDGTGYRCSVTIPYRAAL